MPPRIVDFHGVRHSFPADFTDDDVATALDQYSKMRVAKIKSKLPQLQQQAQQAQSGWDRQTVPQQLIQGGVRALPTIGGVIGGALGGTAGAAAGVPLGLGAGTPAGAIAGGMQGAALGGGAGRALEQALAPAVGLQSEAPTSPADFAAKTASSMAGQAALQGGPEIALAGGRKIAGGLMKTALGNWGERVAKATDTALRERVGPGFRWWKAPKQLNGLIEQGNQLSKKLLSKATANGAWYDPKPLTQGPAMQRLMSDAAFTDAERSRLAAWNDEVQVGKSLNADGTPMAKPAKQSPLTVDRLRERYASEAAGKFEKAAEGQYEGPAKGLRQEWAKALAQDLRQVNHNAIPGFSEIEGKLSDLINLKNTMTPIARKQAGRIALRSGPGALAGYAIGIPGEPRDFPHRALGAVMGGLATSPAGLSNLALLLQTSPELAPLLTKLSQGGAAVADVTKQQ